MTLETLRAMCLDDVWRTMKTYKYEENALELLVLVEKYKHPYIK